MSGSRLVKRNGKLLRVDQPGEFKQASRSGTTDMRSTLDCVGTLRVLERDGLVRREVYPVIPPRVEYELIELGQNLAGLLTQIRSWAEQHAPDIKDARARAMAGNEGDWAA
ncbi:helix-turn-helix domain-containing protein [Mesorhizobium sp. SARCC-RB16n]|uniref:winged helix-turn-helix transcriptional regulator n=1 Tax=Mesorhizobium sp. SARCC-RB16n TaxID=2116687 RepID=UPI001FF03AF5|nr:helix-turn-helix domain-containing protein [Mesorhizobium sp. SARCC-RB16n]